MVPNCAVPEGYWRECVTAAFKSRRGLCDDRLGSVGSLAADLWRGD